MRPTTRTSRLLAGIALPLALLVGIGVSGCTAATPHATPTSTAKASAKGGSGAVTDITHKPGTRSDFVGAVKDVKLTSCEADTSPARFGGTVTNPTSKKQSYRIYVSLLADTKTVGVREIDVKNVAGKATQEWSGTLDAGAKGATCVLRVERHD